MSIEVTGPDSAVHEFPDGTNPTVIKGVMAKVYGPPKTGAPPRTEVSSRQPGVGESPRYTEAVGARAHEGMQSIRGANKSLAQNPLDLGAVLRGAGGAQEVLESPGTGGLDALSKAAYGGRNSLTDPKRVRQLGDTAEFVTPLPGGKAGKAEGIVTSAVKEAGELHAALGAAKKGVGIDTKNMAAREQRLHAMRVDMLKKGGVDKLMEGQVKGGPARAKEAAKIEGGLTQPVYIKRAKLANDSFQRGTYNQALDELHSGKLSRYPPAGPVGNAGVARVQKTINQAYSRLLPKLRLVVDDKLTEGLAKLEERAEEGLRSPEAATFFRSLDRTVRQQLSPGAELDGQTFKTMESELTRDIQSLRKSPLHRREQEVLEDYLGEIRDAAARSSPKEITSQLKAANRAYAKLAKIEDAASAHSDAAGHFTPKDLLDAVKGEDTSPRNRTFAAGKAHMQRWADAAHQVMRRDTEGEAALGVHVPYASTHGIATAAARGVARPVARFLAGSKFEREAVKAAQEKTRSRFEKRRPGDDK
jgi:hypothetical protein